MWGLNYKICRAVRPDLWEYAAQCLAEGPMERVENHLETCASCRSELETLRQAQTALTEVRREVVPAPRSGWADLQRRLAEETPVAVSERWLPSRQTERGAGWMPRIAMASGVAGMLLVAALAYRGTRPTANTTSTSNPGTPLTAFAAPTGNPFPNMGLRTVANDHSGKVEKTAPLTTGNSVSLEPPPVKKEIHRELATTKPAPVQKESTEKPQEPVRVRPTEKKTEVADKTTPKPNKKNAPKLREDDGALKFEMHVPTDAERKQMAENAKERNRTAIMNTIVPVSHDEDSIY